MSAINIKVEAVKVIFGEAIVQVEKIICRDNTVAHPLLNRYFTISTPNGEKHVFWFNDGSVGASAPVIPNTTRYYPVMISPTSTAAQVATAIYTVNDDIGSFHIVVPTDNTVLLDTTIVGYASQAVDGVAPSFNTDFGFELIAQGDTEDELGCMEGDIPVTFDEAFVTVKCHESGTTPIAELKLGVNKVEVTMTALETTTAQLKKLFTYTGGSFTPNGGTEVFGMGTYKNFENMFKYARKLVLHPVKRLAGDKSEDITFHKAIPNLKGLTFSGEKVFTLPLTFKVFPAENINSRVNYWSRGDGSQNLA